MAHNIKHAKISKSGTMNSTVKLKSKCGGQGTDKGTIKKGTSVKITSECKNNSKYYYVSYKDKNKKEHAGWVLKNAVSISSTPKSKAELAKQDEKKRNKQSKKAIKSSVKKLSKKGLRKSAIVSKAYTTDVTGIHGVPYSFIERTDMRYNKKVNYGRKYVEKILTKMPILLVTPGEPSFAPNMSKKERTNLIRSVLKASKGQTTALNYLTRNENQRYYSFGFAWTNYYKYVNAMLRYCAIALGIHNVKHRAKGSGKSGKKFKNFKWQDARNNRVKYWINTRSYIPFYIDAETSVSESMGNSTTYSNLKDSINGFSSSAKELQFVLGPIVGAKVAALDDDNTKAAWQNKVDKIADSVSKHLGASKLMTNLVEGVKTVAQGGTVVFPKMWEDSSFTRSYDVSIKLRTPDADKISWYLNICVPLVHLICLAAPRNMDANSFRSPFIVRCYYKGIFNVDMGIISSLSITKGREGAWSVDGLPTEVDISMSIEEMYENISISDTSKNSNKITYKLFRNTGLIDYLGNLCGININEPDMARVVTTYKAFYKNSITDLFGNGFGSLNDSISTYIMNKYSSSPFRM